MKFSAEVSSEELADLMGRLFSNSHAPQYLPAANHLLTGTTYQQPTLPPATPISTPSITDEDIYHYASAAARSTGDIFSNYSTSVQSTIVTSPSAGGDIALYSVDGLSPDSYWSAETENYWSDSDWKEWSTVNAVNTATTQGSKKLQKILTNRPLILGVTATVALVAAIGVFNLLDSIAVSEAPTTNLVQPLESPSPQESPEESGSSPPAEPPNPESIPLQVPSPPAQPRTHQPPEGRGQAFPLPVPLPAAPAN